MDDIWGHVVDRLERHFTREEQPTINGTPFSFEPLFPSPARLVFIDGGNAILFDSPSAIVQLVRVAAVDYDGNQRKATHRKEALCTVTATPEGYAITWSGQAWPDTLVPAQGMTLAQAADLARRLAERALASGFPCVVFDGDLTARHPLEQAVLDSLPMPHCALTKTTTSLTDQGTSLVAALAKAGPATPWLQTITPTRGAVKLHTLSRHAFLIETRRLSLTSAAAALCATNDPSFPGYPYGLIEADRLARVTVREQRALSELLRTRLKGKWQEQSAALDAHTILDNIAGSTTE